MTADKKEQQQFAEIRFSGMLKTEVPVRDGTKQKLLHADCAEFTFCFIGVNLRHQRLKKRSKNFQDFILRLVF